MQEANGKADETVRQAVQQVVERAELETVRAEATAAKTRIAELESALEDIRKELREWSEHRADPDVVGWPPETDRFGRPLFPRIRREVAAHAIRLLSLGSNPWVFVLDIAGIGPVFALLGGIEDDPLWTDPRPLIRFGLRAAGPRLEYSAVIGRFLEQHGIVVDEYYEWRAETGENGYQRAEDG